MTDPKDRDPTAQAPRPPAPRPPAAPPPGLKPAHATSNKADWLDLLLAEDSTSLRGPQAGAGFLEPGGRGSALQGAGSSWSQDEPSAAGSSAFGAGVERCDMGLCIFWIGSRCFALDIGLVGEVVNVDRVVDIPLAPPAFVGLFNLRGTPVALVDLAKVLQLGDTPPLNVAAEERSLLALVLRFSDMTVGARIDKMQAVVPPGKEGLIRAEGGDHPLVYGFLAGNEAARGTVTVLDAAVLTERFTGLKFAAQSAKS